MDLLRLGHAVIVSNVAAYHQRSNRDVEALMAVHQAVGFDVQVHTNCDTQVLNKRNTGDHNIN